MVKITKTTAGVSMTIKLEGRLDSVTAPQFEAELKSSLEGITELTLDFSALDYLSSAGLRVILAAQKVMNKKGSMQISNVSQTIMNVFKITGFTDLLTIT
jgi:anti-sigma B factor antagonist